MSVRDQNLEAVAPVLATLAISQTAGVDDLKDADLGEPVAGRAHPVLRARSVGVGPTRV